MNGLQLKSESSFKAACILKGKNHHCSSIHCSYYSCYQMMLYVFHEKFKISKSSLKREVRKISSDEEIGSHDATFSYFKMTLFNKDFSLGNKFKDEIYDNIKKLKDLRHKADYTPTDFSTKESQDAIDYAKKVKDYFNSNF